MAALSSPTRRMLTKAEAANYCGFESGAGFSAAVPVAPVRIGSKLLYDQRQLDTWLDQLSNPVPRKRSFAERAGNDSPDQRH
jgi:hypothetical protein